ncbi:unnamed protein product [Medioppia subpectinata]|uniref:Ethanolamine kinase n=1 Tax=Medioppia subpectinata TaxID=1979941 RepID=A0A7R9KB50_9ACAR|nr:unnamed protein product [Medioppia subpectinata]CAG2100172.1 unnamed protein product [Medioppia subpectinata]
MKNKAYDMCQQYLSGQWDHITRDEMVFKTIRNGSNDLYYCSLSEDREPVANEPKHVLLRLYGIGTTIPGDDYKVTDSLITMLLSERGLGPKLYGVFPGGRLEEFIPSRTIERQELKEPAYMAIIAKKFAQIHRLDVPVDKHPDYLFKTLEQSIDTVLNHKPGPEDTNLCPNPELERELLAYDFRRELRWLRRVLPECGSPVVFAHNDLTYGNILIPDDPLAYEDGLLAIDYEFAAYNYRGFDFGSHFMQSATRLTQIEFNTDYPYFRVDFDAYPTDEEKRHFMCHYIKHSPDLSAGKETEDQLIKECDCFALPAYLLWTLWSLSKLRTSSVRYCFWACVMCRQYLSGQWDYITK